MGGTPARSLRFGKNRHLKRNRDFARLKAHGKRMVKGCLTANWCDLPGGSRPRLGVITSRRIGGAVVRSRARRLLREVFRLHQNDLAQPIDLVLIARSSIVGKDFGGVERDFLAAMNQAGVLKGT